MTKEPFKKINLLHMKKWIIKNKKYLIGASIGAVSGYAYWYYVGCSTGTCMFTSDPVNSTIYFAVTGAVVVGTLEINTKERAHAKRKS
jgi:hypothetical protein